MISCLKSGRLELLNFLEGAESTAPDIGCGLDKINRSLLDRDTRLLWQYIRSRL